MKRTDVTYGQLDSVLRSFGFTRRLLKKDPPAFRYELPEAGALISLPPFPESDKVLDYHLVAVRTTLDLNGIAEPEVFEAELQKASGRVPNGSSGSLRGRGVRKP